MIQLDYLRTITLNYGGDCRLLGVTPAPHRIYVEEVYGEGGWIAQHAFDDSGALLASVDEHGGDATPQPLDLPVNLAAPGTGWQSMTLNTVGAPPHGLMRENRVLETAHPLKSREKEFLIEGGYLEGVLPQHILGLIGSYVISETKLARMAYLISRRLRLALRLTEPQTDEAGAPYDYTSREIAVVQAFYPQVPDLPLYETVLGAGVLGAALNWPTDLLIRDGLLVIADAGARGFAPEGAGMSSRIHLWRVVVEADDPLAEDPAR